MRLMLVKVRRWLGPYALPLLSLSLCEYMPASLTLAAHSMAFALPEFVHATSRGSKQALYQTAPSLMCSHRPRRTVALAVFSTVGFITR